MYLRVSRPAAVFYPRSGAAAGPWAAARSRARSRAGLSGAVPWWWLQLGGLSGLGAVAQVLDPSTVATIRNAIISQEGAPSGTTNPGNLVYIGPTELGFPVTKDSRGFAVFPSYAAGVQALDNQIQLYAGQGMTIQQMMSTYAPAGDGANDPVLYAQRVASALGVDSSASLTDLGGGSSVYTLGDDLSSVFSAPDLSADVLGADPVLIAAGAVVGGLLLWSIFR